MALEERSNPSIHSRPQSPEGAPTPTRGPRSQGPTQGFLWDRQLSELQEPEGDGPLASGLEAFGWGHVQGARVSISGVPVCVAR